MQKACAKCGVIYPHTTEHFNKKADRLTSRCKVCLAEDKRLAWARDGEKVNAERRANRSDAERERDRKRYWQERDKRIAQRKAYRERNLDKAKAADARYYRANVEKVKAQAREWADRNKERKRITLREWHRRQRATNPTYRLSASVSAYVYWCLKRAKAGRKTFDLLGYTAEELRTHLERQFTKGMTWANYGEWHVDHIVPESSFTYSTPDDPDFKACWSMTNLRPLWSLDNRTKADKRTHLL